MKSKLILLIPIISICISLEHIVETYSNGMPKVVKTYNGYGKLQLNKEMGYYSDGTQKYQKTYYNGKIQNTQSWDREGKKISKHYKNKGKIEWSDSQRMELFSECMKSPGSMKSICNCQVDIMSSEFAYEEYMKFNSMNPEDITKEVEERVKELISDMRECVGPIEGLE